MNISEGRWFIDGLALRSMVFICLAATCVRQAFGETVQMAVRTQAAISPIRWHKRAHVDCRRPVIRKNS
jgi:hypothetical protein